MIIKSVGGKKAAVIEMETIGPLYMHTNIDRYITVVFSFLFFFGCVCVGGGGFVYVYVCVLTQLTPPYRTIRPMFKGRGGGAKTIGISHIFCTNISQEIKGRIQSFCYHDIKEEKI